MAVSGNEAAFFMPQSVSYAFNIQIFCVLIINNANFKKQEKQRSTDNSILRKAKY